jgi:hypothetical protein
MGPQMFSFYSCQQLKNKENVLAMPQAVNSPNVSALADYCRRRSSNWFIKKKIMNKRKK